MGGGRGGAHLHQGQHAEKRVVCITVRKVLGNCQNDFNMLSKLFQNYSKMISNMISNRSQKILNPRESMLSVQNHKQPKENQYALFLT